jgi:disulfide oxidoreductase YuzD
VGLAEDSEVTTINGQCGGVMHIFLSPTSPDVLEWIKSKVTKKYSACLFKCSIETQGTEAASQIDDTVRAACVSFDNRITALIKNKSESSTDPKTRKTFAEWEKDFRDYVPIPLAELNRTCASSGIRWKANVQALRPEEYARAWASTFARNVDEDIEDTANAEDAEIIEETQGPGQGNSKSYSAQCSIRLTSSDLMR